MAPRPIATGPSTHYCDVVIETLADSEAELRDHVRILVSTVADLAFENFVLRCLFERELVERIHSAAALDQERRRRRRSRSQQAAA